MVWPADLGIHAYDNPEESAQFRHVPFPDRGYGSPGNSPFLDYNLTRFAATKEIRYYSAE
jgi:hypothetical protein